MTNGIILATVIWTTFAPTISPSVLTLEAEAECPGLTLRFVNTRVHDPEDWFTPHEMDGQGWGIIKVRVRYGGSRGDEAESIHLEPGSPYLLADPETLELIDALEVDEDSTGIACLVGPFS